MLDARARSMGLGSLHTLTLAEALTKATECRKLCLDGIDLIEAREKARTVSRLDAANSIPFDACSDAYFEAHRKGWRNEKHADQWRNSLRRLRLTGVRRPSRPGDRHRAGDAGD